MKIQIISYRVGENWRGSYEYTYSTLNQPESLDSFDINIISLQDENLWYHRDNDTKSINQIHDFESLKVLIERAKNTKIIVFLPQNYDFHYYLDFRGNGYLHQAQLKNILTNLTSILSSLLPVVPNIIYEKTKTNCHGLEICAQFSLALDSSRSLTHSIGGNHPTTIQVTENLICTSLDFSALRAQEEGMDSFLSSIGLIQSKTKIPSWMSDLRYFDDQAQNDLIASAESEIRALTTKIEAASDKLKENNRYKSILFTNGNELVSVVFDILTQLLAYDLSNFIDEKREDFLIPLPEITFIGEIKGITSNVKSENISQLECHYQSYLDQLDEEERTEIVKGILIINPFRSKPLSERDPIHEKQVQLAIKYNSLIITTHVLLRLFESFLNGEISVDQIIELFRSKTGLLTETDFK